MQHNALELIADWLLTLYVLESSIMHFGRNCYLIFTNGEEALLENDRISYLSFLKNHNIPAKKRFT